MPIDGPTTGRAWARAVKTEAISEIFPSTILSKIDSFPEISSKAACRAIAAKGPAPGIKLTAITAAILMISTFISSTNFPAFLSSSSICFKDSRTSSLAS